MSARVRRSRQETQLPGQPIRPSMCGISIAAEKPGETEGDKLDHSAPVARKDLTLSAF